ncbi:MAG TPA: host-nuclease inhibitor Gam family protein [Rhodanobacteraceae bacterium]|nr:host-nuclease inhibitor Gam family protein [Rhodanobacteraceae bacterium]
MNAIPTPANGLDSVEQCAANYRAARDDLRTLGTDANSALERIKQAHLPALRQAVAAVAQAESALRDAIEASPAELWTKARTRTLHGVRVGWTKQRGKVEMVEEARTIARIRELLPLDQAALLIRVREAVHKPAVYDLTAADLRRLGIRISDDTDAVVVKDLTSELDRAIEALLAQAAQVDEEAA